MRSDAILAGNYPALLRFSSLRALAALFALTLRQYIRGRRLLVLSLLFCLPGVLAAVVALVSRRTPPADNIQFAFIYNLIPHALAPLAALLYASGIVQDEVEEQTLTYLLLRPLPRWTVYFARWLAAVLITSALTTIFSIAAFAVIAQTAKNPESTAQAEKDTAKNPEPTAQAEKNAAKNPQQVDYLLPALSLVAILALVEVGYCGLFGLLGVLIRRSLMIGVAYIVFIEGIMASFDTIARRLTVMYYYRVLTLRWIAPPNGKDWDIILYTAPSSRACVLSLLCAGLVLALSAAFLFAAKEYRMKTPEGN
jgi:ABC-2 type transport system permease protein